MITDKKTVVNIFTMPQQFPCGPQSSCCGPIGQSEDVIKDLTETISRKLKCQVEIFNVMDKTQMKNHDAVAHIINSFGPGALPIIAIDDDVVSMGNPTPDEVIASIKEKIKG
jgi:disulfide oxidoreductase YuzD